MDQHSSIYFTALIFLIFFVTGNSGTTFTITNKCSYTIWPGILSNAGSDRLSSTGFELPPTGTQNFPTPPNWSGRVWARTGCETDPTTGQFGCATGDCGSGQVECNGNGANPPATLAEFTVAAGGQDFYDVSLVDGYNLPAMIEATRGLGACESTGCVSDLNRQCPSELRVVGGEACKSACEAFGKAEYCCSGEFGSPDTCKPSVYSAIFKSACPKSYSYAYDDPTSTFTCSGADYTITFCPSSTSQKSASTSPPTSTTINGSTTIGGGGSNSGGFQITDNSYPSWLPNFDIGESTKLSSSTLQATILTLSITLLISFSLFLF